jgi:glycosyltransferase involved in cell wall biosynthesis
MPKDRIAVVPHGVAFPSDTAIVDGSRYLLYVGEAIRYRRTLELFRSFGALAARCAEVPPLFAVGKARPVDEPYERECRAILESLERSGRAKWLGRRSHGDVLRLMASAHAFVYPSVHEDCPNIVLEALAAGRPSVFADIPAVRELADDAAVYVRDPRETTLAEALERVTFDEPLRARLAAGSRRRAQLFSWDLTVRRTAEVLESAFDRFPPQL